MQERKDTKSGRRRNATVGAALDFVTTSQGL